MEVQVQDSNIEEAIRRLKKLIAVDGILIQLKMRSLSHKHSNFIKMKRAKAERRKKKMNGRVDAAIQRHNGSGHAF